MWLATHGHQEHIIWIWYGFSRAKNVRLWQINLNNQFFKISNFKFYIYGKVLQHENALSHILTFNIFVTKYQSNINVPNVTGWSGHLSFLTSTFPSCECWNCPSFGTHPCTTQNVGHPSMWGTNPWVRGMGTWHFGRVQKIKIFWRGGYPYLNLPLL